MTLAAGGTALLVYERPHGPGAAGHRLLDPAHVGAARYATGERADDEQADDEHALDEHTADRPTGHQGPDVHSRRPVRQRGRRR